MKRICRRRVKKPVQKLEIVSTCDKCGKPLGRDNIRTPNSAVCASGVGIHVLFSAPSKINYFCSKDCVDAFSDCF
jgi:hypothetical protein